MLDLIVLILLAIGFGFFSTQNSQPVLLTFGQYKIYGAPLYLVIGITLLIGLLLAGILSVINSFFTSLELRGKDDSIKNSKKTIRELTKRVNELEIENANLKGKRENDVLREDSL